MSKFTHLHLHTEYSLLDGLIMIPQLVNKVKELGMNAVAMTDHGVMNGLYPFWKECTSNGVKPIIGCEVYVSRTTRTDRETLLGKKSPYHLILLAQTQEGYHNLVKLVSAGHVEGFYRKPRIDRELLEKYSRGIVCLSACLASELSRHIIDNKYEEAKQAAQYYKDLFGDNYYIELQRNGIDLQEQVNPHLMNISKELEIPFVATCDSHYLDKGDGKLQEVMWCVSDGKKLDDGNRRRSYGEEFYVKSPDEMYELFKDLPDAVENTQKIADSIEEVTIEFDRIIPKFWGDLKGKGAETVLREQTFEGAKEKYGEITEDLEKRLNYELEVIHTKGYDDYFLIVGDLMRWARSQDIVVSVRGSAGGSVVAYCLDIINIEPIGWNCYFERFLNPERPSPPDIDIDLQDDRRDEVINYIQEKYGEGFSAICAIGRMKTKAAIRDVGRVMDIELALTDKLSKLVHVKFGKVKKIKQMIEDDREFAQIVQSDRRLQELVEIVHKIEGIARHVSTHACGYLITPKAITDYIPVQMETGTRNRVITQIEGAQLEGLGFMKFDFLGLRNLTIINNTLQLVNKEVVGQDRLTTKNIPLDDVETFKTFSAGRTTGVFQFESSGMKKYLKKLKPTSLEDICFMAAAYRPGPMQFIDGYIDCKYGRKEAEYLIPELKPIIGVTHGYAIYQEQVIKISVDIAGYSMGGADLLRRAMGKKKMEIMKQEEPIFKEGVMKRGYNKEIAGKIWEYLLPFADYGFNKAHAAGYALVAYWTAYLKTHYPTEFIAGLIQSDIDDMDRLSIDLEEAQQLGVEVLPPDVNESGEEFNIIENTAEKKVIRFGLKAIKTFGQNVAHAIIEERNAGGPFDTFEDLLIRVKHKDLNKKSIEALTKAGALSSLIEANTVLLNIDSILKFIKDTQSEASSGQESLFGGLDSAPVYKLNLENVEPTPTKQLLLWEKEYLGCYISGHPFKWIEDYLKHVAIPYKELGAFEGTNVKLAGNIQQIRKILTKKNDPMAFVRLENTSSTIEVVVFPRTYEEVVDLLEEDIPVMIEGTVSNKGGVTNILANKIVKITRSNIKEIALQFNQVKQPEKRNFYQKKEEKQEIPKPQVQPHFVLTLSDIPDQAILLKMKGLFEQYPGSHPVFLHVDGRKIKTQTAVNKSEELITELKGLLGQRCISVS